MGGIASGMMGIGGGLIMVPAMVLVLGYSQHMAQGTSLAMMLPPIGILAAWKYYQSGSINFTSAIILAIGFVVGGLIGASLVQPISETTLRRIFGVVMLLVSLKMIFKS